MKWLPIKSETLSPFHQQNPLEPHLIDQRSTLTRESQHRIEGIIKPQTSKQTGMMRIQGNPIRQQMRIAIECQNRKLVITGFTVFSLHILKNKKKKRPKHCNQGKQNPLNNLEKKQQFLTFRKLNLSIPRDYQ